MLIESLVNGPGVCPAPTTIATLFLSLIIAPSAIYFGLPHWERTTGFSRSTSSRCPLHYSPLT